MKQKPPKRISQRKLLGILAGVIFVLLLVGFATLAYVATQSTATPNANAPILGTWQKETGTAVIQFRSDGTARYRGGSPHVEYMEWTLDENNELCMSNHTYTVSRLWILKINNWIHGQSEPYMKPTEIEMISETEFRLVTKKSDGEETAIVYKAASDAELEASP